jgi:hypothetical protein
MMYLVKAQVQATVEIAVDADTEEDAAKVALTRLNGGEEDVWDRATAFDSELIDVKPD